MEIYKRHHETWTIYNRRNLNDLQIAINKKIHELEEDENLRNLEIKSVSIAGTPSYNRGTEYTSWYACLTYSYIVDNCE